MTWLVCWVRGHERSADPPGYFHSHERCARCGHLIESPMVAPRSWAGGMSDGKVSFSTLDEPTSWDGDWIEIDYRVFRSWLCHPILTFRWWRGVA